MVKATQMSHFREKGVHVYINKSLPPIRYEQVKS